MKLKRYITLLFVAVLVLCFSGCSSLSLKAATLQDTIELPENGIISESFFKQLKEQNGVVTIAGKSGDLRYEWTVFGSDIETPKDCNMAVELSGQGISGLSVRFLAVEEFGFSPVISVYLNEQWDTQSALVYCITNGNKDAVCSASVTGSKTSILNFSVLSSVGSFAVIPELAVIESSTSSKPTASNSGTASGTDPYLSDNTPSDSQIYTDAPPTEQDKYKTESKPTASNSGTASGTDPYLSDNTPSDSRIYSDGSSTEQDKYKTDPVPEGKPIPVEPEDQTVNQKKSYTCTFSIECSTILNNLGDLNTDKLDEVPSNGVIFPKTTVTFYEGESVYDVLQRICKENNIHMEASWTPIYNSAYVEGIHNLYEFDCGSGSGWMYRVDGWYPNYGCSRYQLKQGENIEWRYTCDLGNDVGGGYAIGG